jgi:hypothetical protein
VVAALLTGTVNASSTIAEPVARTGEPAAVTATEPSHTDDGRRQVAGRKRDAERVTTGLEVTIEQLSPSSLVPSEPLTVSGTVTNLDPQVWQDLQVFLVIDPTPSTTAEELDAVLASPPTSYSGDRICCNEDWYAEIGSLAPGASTSYTVSVPFSQLALDAGPSGAYTVSVHVLGERGQQGRLPGADGRARILVPFLSDQDEPVGLAVVIPLHYPLERAVDGTYTDVDDLVDSISLGGMLRNRLDLVAGAETGQATLLVDPALLDALQDISVDRFGPGVRVDPGEESQDTAEANSDAAAASEFLDRLKLAAARSDVLVEPYGQADLTAVTQRPQYRLARTVRQVGRRALAAAGITGEPVLRATEQLYPSALSKIAHNRLVLVGSDQVNGWSTTDGPRARLPNEERAPVPIAVADSSLQLGGPSPGPSDGPLQVRQRLLAEAALLSVAPTSPGLVFLPSDDWDPGPGTVGAELFESLNTSWIYSSSVLSLAARGLPTRVTPVTFELAAPPLPPSVLTAAVSLRRHAQVYSAVTGPQTPVLPYYHEATALALSTQLRDDPLTAERLALETRETIDSQLDRITVEGAEFVTLSSDTGFFPITLTNGLDHPVVVGAVIEDDEGILTVDDIEPQQLAANTSIQVTVPVQAGDVGVTRVSARLVTENGRRFGPPAAFQVRSSVVGEIIWYVLGAFGVIFVLLVVRRIVHRRRPGPEPGLAP